MSETKKVYQAINEVTAALAEVGIDKSRRNKEQGYQYRGIDDVYNALGPILAKCKLVILPRIIERTQETRQTHKGANIYLVLLQVEFDFISTEDGSTHTITMYGEALDMADKATNKALSAAYKYAMLTVFCVPVQGMLDPDSTTPPETVAEPLIVPKKEGKPPKQDKPPKANNGSLSLNELADLLIKIEETTDDPGAKAMCGEVYTQRNAIPTHRREEIGRKALGKRSELVIEPCIESFEKNCEAFVATGLISQKEANVLRSAARSRLNLPQE